ncbi:hypothetical protein ABW21_db0202376 [Orbilia brochopaga]|nr:hypothetical protein ABW21_db0202376 [Drechslerella brochopaga]
MTPDWFTQAGGSTSVQGRRVDYKVLLDLKRRKKLKQVLEHPELADPDYVYSLRSREDREAELDSWRYSDGARQMGILGWGLGGLGLGKGSIGLKKRELSRSAAAASHGASGTGLAELGDQSLPTCPKRDEAHACTEPSSKDDTFHAVDIKNPAIPSSEEDSEGTEASDLEADKRR